MSRYLSILFLSNFLAIASLLAFEPLYERAPIYYHETEADTNLTRLLAKAESGGPLARGTDREILANLLRALEVPIESQVLVFSKTSEQNSRISPQTPRAIYFSDNTYVGWVQGGEIEVASFDRKLGLVFHLVELSSREEDHPPKLTRARSCLNCHAGSSNQNLPGLMVRSVYPAETGQPLFQAGTFHTRQDSPIEERWGGWYVTGSVDESTHLGNQFAQGDRSGNEVTLHSLSETNLTTLDGIVNAEPYLHGGQSDAVALMVLEHQVGVHNALIEANLTTRTTLHRHAEMQKAFGEPVDGPLSETNRRILDNMAERVLKQILYVDEFVLPGGVEGSESFQEGFQRNERKSTAGRSLKDFRLYERLMKYRCSHLIYSDAFDQLPDEIRVAVLDRLHGILTEPASHPDFGHLSPSEREHIFEIISETLPRLSPAWGN
ncbi:MAG: hypothetical protein P1U68_01745 [Verrucomicrobiales bacterium]|nr:hypothetical protein [Verrucomicrobiales bacterium]